MSRVDNRKFDPRKGFDRERGGLAMAMWYAVKVAFFLSAIPWPSSVKCSLLRIFGAEVGERVYIKPRVNIHFPWKLSVGDDAWIGEQVEIYNFERVSIGANACISQRAFLCAGNHDYRDPAMCYRNAPVSIFDGAWIGACVVVGPGVRVGVDAVATAGSVVVKDLPEGMVCTGNPCVPVRPRWNDE